MKRLSSAKICGLVNAVRLLRFFFTACDPFENILLIRSTVASMMEENRKRKRWITIELVSNLNYNFFKI
jgi:hypothetical protein